MRRAPETYPEYLARRAAEFRAAQIRRMQGPLCEKYFVKYEKTIPEVVRVYKAAWEAGKREEEERARRVREESERVEREEVERKRVREEKKVAKKALAEQKAKEKVEKEKAEKEKVEKDEKDKDGKVML